MPYDWTTNWKRDWMRCVKKTATMMRGNNCSKLDSLERLDSASRSVLVTFSRKPSRWMEGHDLDEPEDWYPAVAARSRRCLVSTSIAKQPEREIRPAISPLASSFSLSSFLCLSFASQAPSFVPSLPLFFSRSLIFTENPERHYPCREDSGRSSKIAFRGSASTERKWSLRQWNKKFFDIVDNASRKNIR